MAVIALDAPSGVYQPTYSVHAYRQGDPRQLIGDGELDWRSIRAIQTSKSIQDLAGTFTITLKDTRARHAIREMDVLRIRLRGHFNDALLTVLKGVVDRVRAPTSSDVYASRADVIIEGRCIGKYLQVNSLFLPVWDPEAILPTALTFGLGDPTNKAGGRRPFDINAYLVRRFVLGLPGVAGRSGAAEVVGLSSTPAARRWLDYTTRFAKGLGFEVPFLRFDENSIAECFKTLEVLGFTEAWIDELGRQVYRHPQWDAPARYSIQTGALIDSDLSRSDVGVATYVEVIPAGDPGIDSATAQALRAGRAPVPSAYVHKDGDPVADQDFIIKTDSKGRITKAGQANHWYQLQRRLGLRPQQITSPLIFTKEQAQRQAEGLLRFLSRTLKSGTITLPLAPEVRLGYTCRLHGHVDAQGIDRTYYIEGVAHDYVEDEQGGHAFTTVSLTHGRDPWDPRWGEIALPAFDPTDLYTKPSSGGVIRPGFDTPGPDTGGQATGQTGDVRVDPGNGSFVQQTTRPDGKRVLPADFLDEFLGELAGGFGETVFTNTYSRHPQMTSDGNPSEHWIGHAADLNVTNHGGNWPNEYGMRLAFHAFRLCGLSVAEATALARGGGDYNRPPRYFWTWQGQRYVVQILWGPAVGHVDHVHVGLHPG